ncbi:hypothetical protein C7G41_12810 [Bradyrhizobium sp. MOS002]|nr:hypothetical protein C7G41_12810 [Bradyrhizobium sp. MOS002]
MASETEPLFCNGAESLIGPAPIETSLVHQISDAGAFYVLASSGSCSVPHCEDLHRLPYQYAEQFLTRHEVRRIAPASLA